MGIYSAIVANPAAAQAKWNSLSKANQDKVLGVAGTGGARQYQAWMNNGGSTRATQVLSSLPAPVQAAILGDGTAAAAGGGTGPGAQGSSSLSGGGAASGSAATSTSDYQKDPYGTTKDLSLTDPNDLDKMGLSLTPKQDYTALKNSYDKVRNDLGLSADKMNAANEAFLKGEIPADVMAQIRRQTSQSSVAGGLFGQGSRALTATDIGLTSTQMIQTGIQQQGQIAGVQEVAAKLDESRRQFNKQFDLNVNQFQEQVRSGNLQGLALEQQRLEFNAKQNLALTEMVQNSIFQQQTLGYSYAAAGVDPGGTNETFSNWIDELRNQLGS